jgi:hypothetical protein
MVIAAIVLATVPFWTPLLMVVPDPGFLLYLWISNAYYSLPRLLFGSRLFPAEEFGVIPKGAAAIVLAALLYALLGVAAGWVPGALRSSSKNE